MSYRSDFKTAAMRHDELADMLAEPLPDTRRLAAEAELRLRDHRAILVQAACAKRTASAAERQAAAAERGTRATVTYVRLTFGLLVFTALAALAALAGLQNSCIRGFVSAPPTVNPPAATRERTPGAG
jgi:hypothetical protein